MLKTQVVQPRGAGAGTPVVVLLHGRGADESDLVPLKGALPDSLALVLPRAPHAGMQWGYGPGWAWYRYEGEDRPEVESFRASQRALSELLSGLPDVLGYEPGRVTLGGFSQGGTMSLGYALQNPGAVPSVLVFSGFLPSHPDVEVTPETVAGTAFWWGHGTQDPAVHHRLAVKGRGALADADADLTSHDYAMGHGILPQELGDAAAWLEGQLT